VGCEGVEGIVGCEGVEGNVGCEGVEGNVGLRGKNFKFVDKRQPVHSEEKRAYCLTTMKAVRGGISAL
jgi:hypothetical protein